MKPPKAPLPTVLLLSLALLLASGAVLAHAEPVQQGNLSVDVNGNLSPHRLPRSGSVPVAVTVSGKISTTDQTQPPQLQKLTIEINRHGLIDSTGLPTCQLQKIETANNAHAIAACGPSLVGSGQFLGTITLPGSSPYPIKGRLGLQRQRRKQARPLRPHLQPDSLRHVLRDRL